MNISIEQIAKMTPEEIKAMFDAKSTAGNKLSLKVSEQGAVSIYGLGRFPTTLYDGQWNRLLDYADTIREFLKANAVELERIGKDKEANPAKYAAMAKAKKAAQAKA